MLRGDESRRRRGRDVDIPRRRGERLRYNGLLYPRVRAGLRKQFAGRRSDAAFAFSNHLLQIFSTQIGLAIYAMSRGVGPSASARAHAMALFSYSLNTSWFYGVTVLRRRRESRVD